MILRKTTWVLTLLTMAFIFYMSSRSIPESRSDSAHVMSFIGLVEHKEDAMAIENPSIFRLQQSVRKYAHFIIYAGLGMLIYASVYGYFGGIVKSWYISLLLTSFYGTTDEIHQIFTNRGALALDVYYDTIGGLAGAIIMGSIFYIIINNNRLFKIVSRTYDFNPGRIL